MLDAIRTRKTNDALLQIAIVQNPYTEKPNVLVDSLRRLGNSEVREDGIDRQGLSQLKKQLKKESKFISVAK